MQDNHPTSVFVEFPRILHHESPRNLEMSVVVGSCRSCKQVVYAEFGDKGGIVVDGQLESEIKRKGVRAGLKEKQSLMS